MTINRLRRLIRGIRDNSVSHQKDSPSPYLATVDRGDAEFPDQIVEGYEGRQVARKIILSGWQKDAIASSI